MKCTSGSVCFWFTNTKHSSTNASRRVRTNEAPLFVDGIASSKFLRGVELAICTSNCARIVKDETVLLAANDRVSTIL